jgi:hypothetical protein
MICTTAIWSLADTTATSPTGASGSRAVLTAH